MEPQDVRENVSPFGPRLLGEILTSGLTDLTTGPLLATLIELDTMQTHRLADLWRNADETLAETVFALEAAWRALSNSWLVTRERIKQINAAMSEVKAQQGLDREEMRGKLLEVDEALGGPEMRKQMAERLRELIRAHELLPFVGTCKTCGHHTLVP